MRSGQGWNLHMKKMAKLQTLKEKYETLKMSEDENITSYIQKVSELVCSINVLVESWKN